MRNPASLLSIGVLAAATLAGCIGGAIVTDPNAVRIEPFRLSELRAPQAVTLVNGLHAEARHEIRTDQSTWVLDSRQMTDTAIAVLRRALENRGVSAAAASPKTITLRIQPRGGTALFVPVPTVTASARLILEADFGDGTATWVDGESGSAFGVQRAFEGAILAALHRLLLDGRFIAYMNR